MRNRLLFAIVAASVVLAPGLVLGRSNTNGCAGRSGKPAGTAARLYRDERALLGAARDLASIARQHVILGEAQAGRAAQHSLKEAARATRNALVQLRRSISAALSAG